MNERYEDYETRAREEKLPIPYEIFKGIKGNSGVLSLELREAYTNDPSKSNKPSGIVFLHMTPTVGPNQYDWENKVSFALSLVDIGKILLFMRNPARANIRDVEGGHLNLIHDWGMRSGRDKGSNITRLSIGKSDRNDNFLFNIERKQDRETTAKFMVPVTPDEGIIVMTLLQAAIPAILSWSPPPKPVTIYKD